ncbi:MAG: 50S ribosomal protein L5 [Proteobacteria bacterium]|nr:50S ribosomal protein L5 [Pseudomonadota bacterium]
MAQLREFYKKEVIPSLTRQFAYDNPMRVPKVTKVVLNMGLGEAVADKKVLEKATADLTMIAGQKVVVTKARKSIAGFKIREGWPVGCKVTLRGERMYEFLERLVSIAIPRIRDFRGLSPKSFDGRGNFAMGVTEQIIFPEIDYDKIDALRGLDITITTSAKNDEEGRALLTALRFPFRQPTVETEAASAVKAAAKKEQAPVVEEAAAEEAAAKKVVEEAAAPVAEEAATEQAPEGKDVAADTAEENVDAVAAAKDKEES